MQAPPGPAAPVSIDLSTTVRPPAPPRAGWPVITGAAACAALLVVGAALTRGEPPGAAAGGEAGDPAAVLRAAAAAAERSPDPRPAAGQALLVTIRQFTVEVIPTADGGREVIGLDQLVQEWIPADRREVWVQRTLDAGPPQVWDEQTRAYVPGVPAPATEMRGRCGDYFPSPGQDPCDRPGLWQEPTPAFIAGLPRDPGGLLARLRADAAGNAEDPRQEMLVHAAQALDRGLLPARVRATVYRALALLPGLRILETKMLDGRAGVAVGVQAGGTRVEIVVDPGTGAYVGRCRELVTSQDGLPPGTVTDATSLRTRIVGPAGGRP